MRTDAGYKKLVKGYEFSLSILKEIKPKLYEKMIKAIALLDKHGGLYSDLIRNLRIDYSRSNDTKVAEPPKVVNMNNILYTETLSFSYSPENYYVLGFLYEKKTAISHKKIFVEIVPNDMETVLDNNFAEVLRISRLNEIGHAEKIMEYYAGITDDALEVFEQDLDIPDKLFNILTVPKDCIEDFQIDATNMF